MRKSARLTATDYSHGLTRHRPPDSLSDSGVAITWCVRRRWGNRRLSYSVGLTCGVPLPLPSCGLAMQTVTHVPSCCGMQMLGPCDQITAPNRPLVPLHRSFLQAQLTDHRSSSGIRTRVSGLKDRRPEPTSRWSLAAGLDGVGCQVQPDRREGFRSSLRCTTSIPWALY